MYFINRFDAAMKLSKKLDKYNGQNGVILAVPRGGVPIGFYLARYLHFELDLLMKNCEKFSYSSQISKDNIITE